MNQWMNEWTSLLSHFFCLPASSSAASAARRFSAWRCYHAFSNLQLQSHLPGALQHHWMLCCTQPCQCICHSRLQTRIAGAQHQIDQHSRSVNSAGFLGYAAAFSLLLFKCKSCTLSVGNFPAPRPAHAETDPTFENPEAHCPTRM